LTLLACNPCLGAEILGLLFQHQQPLTVWRSRSGWRKAAGLDAPPAGAAVALAQFQDRRTNRLVTYETHGVEVRTTLGDVPDAAGPAIQHGSAHNATLAARAGASVLLAIRDGALPDDAPCILVRGLDEQRDLLEWIARYVRAALSGQEKRVSARIKAETLSDRDAARIARIA